MWSLEGDLVDREPRDGTSRGDRVKLVPLPAGVADRRGVAVGEVTFREQGEQLGAKDDAPVGWVVSVAVVSAFHHGEGAMSRLFEEIHDGFDGWDRLEGLAGRCHDVGGLKWRQSALKWRQSALKWRQSALKWRQSALKWRQSVLMASIGVEMASIGVEMACGGKTWTGDVKLGLNTWILPQIRVKYVMLDGCLDDLMAFALLL